MRLPEPASLVVDHPAIPVPLELDGGLLPGPPGGRDPARLATADRNRVALQLIAAAALLAEFDLWPGSAAIRTARAIPGPGGVQAVLGGWPRRLTAVTRRLGGGEGAAQLLRDRVVAATALRCGVEVPRGEGDGYFLEPWLRQLLARLGASVDRVTARNLWALRWTVPPAPEAGEVSFWATPETAVADRVAAAAWTAMVRAGRSCWLRRVGGDQDTAPLPPVGARGTLVIAGELSADDLAGLVRWADTPGCSAMAVGLFPAGWSPPSVPLDVGRLDRHLVVAAGSLEAARRVVERRSGRFHPLSRQDRRGVTDDVLALWAPPRRVAAAGGHDHSREALEGLLALLPEGLPEGLVRLHAGLPDVALDSRSEELGVVRRDGRWRLATPSPMVPDPRHGIVAELFEPGDPRRLRHRALADREEAGRLAAWCRRQVLELEGRPVRALLVDVARGALGSEVEAAMAEACLLHQDLAGARAAVDALGEAGGPWRRWLAVAERIGGRTGVLTTRERERAPLAAAAVALDGLRRSGDRGRATAELDAVAGAVGGVVARWIALERAAVEQPGCLADREWRREVTQGHPFLRRRLLHLRALALEGRRASAARRLLNLLAGDDLTPGERAMLEIDLGSAALAEGDSEAADVHGLRALRLLEAAGFESRTRIVRFNLAVSDIDRLRVGSADRRLTALEEAGRDLFVVLERARWHLAVGHLDRFRDCVGRLRIDGATGRDPRLREAYALLDGVRALLEGELAQAAARLALGGEEAASWAAVLDAVRGVEPRGVDGADGWGLGLASRWIAAGSDPQDVGVRDLRGAMALAVAARLVPDRIRVDDRRRAESAAVLREAGLEGWAAELRRAGREPDRALGSLLRLLEEGGPERVGDGDVEALLDWVGVGGIEVRRAGAATPLWRRGDGPPGPVRREFGLDLLPLGGEPPDVVRWRLLAGILDLQLGFAPTADDRPGGRETSPILGMSPEMQTLRAQVASLAPTVVPVLVTGETGSGKELVARELHRLSARRGAFVPVNVAAIPDSLLEAELFGAVRGAYTGADRSRRGLAQTADGGTLFLDEIGDLSPPMQVKLLRFLESGEVRPVGGDLVSRVDARIVAATHRDLPARVAAGTFREDLYFRIAVGRVEVPALRDRPEDIPELRAVFEREAEQRHGLRRCRWTPDAERALARYAWPGNVRELRHAVEVAMIRTAGEPVTPGHLPVGGASPAPAPVRRWNEILDAAKAEALREALRRTGGNRSAAARELGISRQALLYHLRRLGLRDPSP